MDADVFDELLDNSSQDDGRTIWTALRPVIHGQNEPMCVRPYEAYTDGLFYLPGDIRLYEFEEKLPEYWINARRQSKHSLVATCAIGSVVDRIGAQLDLDIAIYDVGPNIGLLYPCRRVELRLPSCPGVMRLTLPPRNQNDGPGSHVLDTGVGSSNEELAPQDIEISHGRPVFIGYIPARFRSYGGRMLRTHRDMLARINREFRGSFP